MGFVDDTLLMCFTDGSCWWAMLMGLSDETCWWGLLMSLFNINKIGNGRRVAGVPIFPPNHLVHDISQIK